jgi:hypothetical protein
MPLGIIWVKQGAAATVLPLFHLRVTYSLRGTNPAEKG